MDDATLGPALTVYFAGPIPSSCEAMCLGEEVVGAFWNCFEREANGIVDFFSASRVCSEVFETGRMRSDLILARDEEFDPKENALDFATDAAWDSGTTEVLARKE